MSTLDPVPGKRNGSVCRWLPSAALAFALCQTSPLAAAPPKGGSKADGESAVRYRRTPSKVTTRSLGTKKGARGKKKADPTPTLTGDAWERERVATSLAVTDDLIKTAKRLMDASDQSDADYPDYIFRLANLFLDKRQILEAQSGKLYEVIDEHRKAGRKKQAQLAKAKQKRLDKAAREASVQAIRAMHALVSSTRFGSYKRMDEALYYYATELGAVGKDAEMQEAYVRLLREFPTSRYRPQVYLSFADHKFNAGEIDSALRLYQQIVDGHDDSPVYAYALYKIGWCHLNPVGGTAADYARSLQSFTAAIAATKQGKAGSEANGRQIRKEARRDMVKAYVHAARPSKAWDFFGRVGNGPKAGEDMQVKMMELLADAYYGEGKYVESSATYKVLQARLPDSDRTCNWQARVVENALATDDESIQWKETKLLASRWEQFKDAEHAKVAKRKCRDDTVDALVRRATTWHDEANKTHREDTYALSREAYTEFARVFPKHKDAYEMRFYLGEVKWALAEAKVDARDRKTQQEGRAMFCEAADAFVDALKSKPKGKFTRDAAYAQMLGWKNCTEYDETGGKSGACVPQSDGTCVYTERHGRRVAHREDTRVDAATRFPVTPYSEAEQHMLDAYARYQKYVKAADDPELPKILYHRGKMMVEHRRFDDSIPVLRRLIDDFDGTRYSAWAAEMLVDVMTIRWADAANTRAEKLAASKRLVALAGKLEKKKLWRKDEAQQLRKSVPALVAATRWTIAQDKCDGAKAGDVDGFIECGRLFHELYEDYPDHDRGDQLLHNAAIAFEAGYLLGNAIKLRKALLADHPDSKLHKETLKRVAENYQAIAYYGEAAQQLEQYAETYRGDKYASTALQNAYIFRSGLGEDEAARGDLNRYEAIYRRKNPEKAAAIYWSQSDLVEDADERLAHAEQYVQRYGTKGGRDRLVVAHATAGQILWRRSCGKSMLADACVTLKRKKAMAGNDAHTEAETLRQVTSSKIPKRCGSATRGVVIVHDRNAKLVARAQKHFDKAVALGRKGVDVPEDDTARQSAFLDAWAMSKVYLSDAKYEQYLKVKMPEALDFYVEPWKKDSGLARWEREYAAQVKRRDDSIARFAEFMTSKRALGESLLTEYGKVAEIKSPYWVLAASARSAVVWQNFADQLHRAVVPKDVKTQDQYDTFCDELTDRAAPMEKMALSAFEYCLDRSTKFQYFNDFSRMCEEELQQREPDRFPATNELFGTSKYTDARMDVVGVQTNLHGDRRLSDAAAHKSRE